MTTQRFYFIFSSRFRFKSQSVYNHHLNTHGTAKNFKCPYCSKAFKTSVQLAGHKNTHTKPFACQVRLLQKDFLNQH